MTAPNYKEKVREYKQQSENWLLRETALENLGRLYERTGRSKLAEVTYWKMVSDFFHYPETKYRGACLLRNLYNNQGCKWASRLCDKLANQIKESRI